MVECFTLLTLGFKKNICILWSTLLFQVYYYKLGKRLAWLVCFAAVTYEFGGCNWVCRQQTPGATQREIINLEEAEIKAGECRSGLMYWSIEMVASIHNITIQIGT